MKTGTSILLLLAAGFFTAACSDNKSASDDAIEAWKQSIPEVCRNTDGIEKFYDAIDYSKAENWLDTPDAIDKPVDVFYIYPTAYFKQAETESAVCDIDNAVMQANAQRYLFNQASVYRQSCNVFAPYYRQMDVPTLGAMSEENVETHFRFSASQDPTRALDYYFEHWNGGRPFIIAGHSQGSAITLMLLEDYFRVHPDRYAQMVAAYPIGYGVTHNDLNNYPHLKFAEGATDTGVIVTWNTEGPQNAGHRNVVVKPDEISINPLNWKRDETYASAEENLGFWVGDGTIAEGFADAKLDLQRGVVIVTAPEAEAYVLSGDLQPFFGPQCYHGQDYAFFYVNLQKNVADRIAAWKAK
ncbi:MAG: DUF3089 domain-containing protein [Bacteroidaceae bacterium]|nr:DUF3089 domain-containing protein [Bacteroidaceae bacterium]